LQEIAGIGVIFGVGRLDQLDQSRGHFLDLTQSLVVNIVIDRALGGRALSVELLEVAAQIGKGVQ
jgi:hypothetical protein